MSEINIIGYKRHCNDTIIYDAEIKEVWYKEQSTYYLDEILDVLPYYDSVSGELNTQYIWIIQKAYKVYNSYLLQAKCGYLYFSANIQDNIDAKRIDPNYIIIRRYIYASSSYHPYYSLQNTLFEISNIYWADGMKKYWEVWNNKKILRYGSYSSYQNSVLIKYKDDMKTLEGIYISLYGTPSCDLNGHRVTWIDVENAPSDGVTSLKMRSGNVSNYNIYDIITGEMTCKGIGGTEIPNIFAIDSNNVLITKSSGVNLYYVWNIENDSVTTIKWGGYERTIESIKDGYIDDWLDPFDSETGTGIVWEICYVQKSLNILTKYYHAVDCKHYFLMPNLYYFSRVVAVSGS